MPDDKIVQDGYLLKEEPEPDVGTGLRHHSAEWGWGEAHPSHTGVGRWVGEHTPACCLILLWALSLISLLRGVWQPPHYSAAV